MAVTTLDVLPKSIVLNKTGDMIVGGIPSTGQNPRGKVFQLGPSGYVLGSNGVNPVWLPYSLTPGTVTSISLVSPSLDLNISNPTVTTTGTISVDLSPTGVLAGTYSTPSITVDSKGRITQITSNTPSSAKNINVKTSNYSLLPQEDGFYYTNHGAVSSIILSLPEPTVGLSYKFFVSTAQNLRVLTTGSTRIHYGLQTTEYGGFIETNVVGSFVSIVALNAIDWYVEYAINDWGLSGIVVVTGSGDITLQQSSKMLVLNKTVSEATTVYLPTTPYIGQTHIIKDAKGDAGTYNITVNGNGNTIDSSVTLLINNNYSALSFVFIGSSWIAM